MINKYDTIVVGDDSGGSTLCRFTDGNGLARKAIACSWSIGRPSRVIQHPRTLCSGSPLPALARWGFLDPPHSYRPPSNQHIYLRVPFFLLAGAPGNSDAPMSRCPR